MILEKKIHRITPVFILDDRPVIFDGVKLWFKALPEYKVLLTTMDWQELRSILKNHKEGLLITSSVFLHDIFNELQEFHNIKVICFCEDKIDLNPDTFFSSNIFGIINSTVDRNEFIHGIRNIAEGKIYISVKIMQSAFHHSMFRSKNNLSEVSLSKREQEVVSLISLGFSDKEIGEVLHLSKRTIDGYRNNLLVKLNARNSAHLVRTAIDRNMVIPEEMLQTSFSI